MSDEFASAVMRHVVTLLAYNVGWDASQTTALDILADIMRRHFLHLAKSTHNFAEFYGRTDPNLDDVALALSELNMSGAELEEYVQNFDPVTLNYAAKVPVFPVKRESKLNFLRPGSEEVLTRPVHVHEYMPPMIFESKKPEEASSSSSPPPEGGHHDHRHHHQSTESSEPIQPEVVEPPAPPLLPPDEVRHDDTAAVEVVSKKRSRKERSMEKEHHHHQNGGLAGPHDDDDDDSSEDEIEGLDSKTPGSKGFVPFSGVGGAKAAKTKKSDNPALKRIRMMIEEDGHPIREVTSVMMTTSGFLSSSREGRLPDTRPPPNREFFDPSPPPPVVEKKKKPLTMKRIVEGIKKIEKESDTADPSHSKDDLDDEEEIPLFGNPDKISTTITAPKSSALFPSSSSKKSDPKSKSSRKMKKKLKIDKETIKKIAAGLEQRDRDKAKSMKMYKKSQTKVLLDKSKKLKDKKFIQQQLELQKMQQQQLLLQQQQQFEADAALHGHDLEEIDSDEEMMSSTKLPPPPPMASAHSLVPPALMRIPKKGGGISKSTPGLVDPVKLKKFKNKSSFMAAATAASLLAPPKFGLPPARGGNLGMERGIGPKKRGRPRKGAQMIPSLAQAQMQAQMAMGFAPGGVPLSAAALANLGRGLMEDRPLKIKKSHMEPDMRSLIPEVQLDLGPHHHVPHHQMGHPPTSTGRLPPGQQQRGGQKQGKKQQLAPPRMTPATGSGAGYDLLLGLPSAPGLIPSNFVLPPPPPLKKMPTPGANSQQMAPLIHISPTGTPSPSKEGGKKGSPFSNVCSSLTITPIDMGSSSGAVGSGGGSHHHKLPPPTTRYDKSSLPATLPSTPPPPPPTLKSKPSRLMRDKSPGVIKSEPSSGITITPIVMEHEHESRGSYPDNSGYSDEASHHLHPHQNEDDEYDESYDNFSADTKPNVSSSVSMLAKLDEDMKSKEARRKEKERRKELKKEKKKDKKEKSGKKEKRDKDRTSSGGGGGSSSKKKSSKETLSVPKLTLKLSGHSSGTATPVDSPNPPPVYVGGDSNPMISPPLKKITIKSTPNQASSAPGESKSSKMMKMPKRTPSPELARFSPLVTRTPKAPRAAKVHAAAAVAAEAMGASLAQQMASFPSTSGQSQKRGGGGGSGARGSSAAAPPPPATTGRGSSSKSAKSSSKSSSALGGLITETVGCIVDESGNKIWICPTCKRQDDGSPMIGCDRCDDWYHFVCQGITDTPEEDTEWYCPRCRIKKKKDKK
ncbi:transcription initiation factor TFIID subunit 3 isoform X3 [Folsomia candida]|uniref:transcription initiation factor TFIID subunit 3 isoform X3 n=1 Tax=Folsomia candida TaxID=158441 RepID=UPI000B907C57|nr:transcription initiation factor TFIID subunit 3 isoform X3 [Folsomia candida]